MSETGREIKVRAWNPNLKRMGKPFTLSDAFYEGFAPPVVDPLSGELERDVIFLQYTGLKDKNGVEIYEGHIILAVPDDDEDQSIHHLVEFDEDGYWIPCFGYQGCDLTGLSSAQRNAPYYDYEVIGNIYQNPQLLEGEKS